MPPFDAILPQKDFIQPFPSTISISSRREAVESIYHFRLSVFSRAEMSAVIPPFERINRCHSKYFIRSIISPGDGRYFLSSRGSFSVSLYVDTPIGFFVSFNAYSTIVRLLPLHKMIPMEGFSSGVLPFIVQGRKIKLHLACIFRLECADFQFYCHKTPQLPVIQQQISIKNSRPISSRYWLPTKVK